MAEELKGLIEKIRQEGVEAAKKKASEIEEEAKRTAEKIRAGARDDADTITSRAKSEAEKTEKRTRDTLEQAARDMLLTLRKTMGAMLDTVVHTHVRASLKPEEMRDVLAKMIGSARREDSSDITVSVSKEDMKKVEAGLFKALGEEAKKGITIRPSENIQGGFVISYDGGKSHFDFSEKALAEYIGTHLKPTLKKILDDAAQGG